MTRRFFLGLTLAALVAGAARGQSGQTPTSAEAALACIFSPHRAPSRRTMGLVQRSFLDLVESSRQKLQVALVIDGTESMGDELVGIRQALDQMIDDLSRYKEGQVTFQMVVYRDSGSPSGEVAFPLNVPNRAFTSDRQMLRQAVSNLRGESGAPYYPEAIDWGIHQALTELDWATDEDTTRWLLVFGDAPPFDEGFEQPEMKARRRIATDQLIATANRLDIKVNCILCSSRPEDQDVYQQVLGKTQDFMNRLSTETGGLMLDLSYPDIRNALAAAAETKRVSYRKIGRITREDILQARRVAAEQQTLVSPTRRTRIAVLPHLPLDGMSFDPGREEVQIAAELRLRFEKVPGVEMRSPAAIERHLAILRGRGVRGDQLLQSLATALRVDYVVWGQVDRSAGTVSVRTAIYDGVAGRTVVEDQQRIQPDRPATSLTARLATNLIQKVVNQNTETRLVATFNNPQRGVYSQSAIVNPVARAPQARTSLLEGFEALEQALAFPVGDAEGEKLLERAKTALEEAVGPNGEPTNPLGYQLLASCHFNRAASAEHRGDAEQAAAARKEAEDALRKAYTFRGEANEFAFVKREIEADYTLFIRRDYAGAINAYTELTGISPDTPLRTVLRAHWMLAGIYTGDWGIAQDPEGQKVIDLEKAREHLIQILAHWEESSEAQFVRKNLRWDDVAGENRFEYLPQTGAHSADRMIDT